MPFMFDRSGVFGLDLTPYIRKIDYTELTGALVAAGYRPYYVRPSMQIVWAQSEDAVVAYLHSYEFVSLRLERETQVGHEDAILIPREDGGYVNVAGEIHNFGTGETVVPEEEKPLTKEDKRFLFARWLYINGFISD